MSQGKNANEGIALGLICGLPLSIGLSALAWWLTHNSSVVAVVGMIVIFGCAQAAQTVLNKRSNRKADEASGEQSSELQRFGSSAV